MTHAPLVRRIAGRLMSRLPSSVAMDDLLQAGLIGAWQAEARYDATQGSFDAFAAKRIRGAMLDELRRMDHVPKDARIRARATGETFLRAEPLDDDADYAEPGLGPCDQLEDRLKREALAEAIEGLPERLRSVLVMHYERGISMRDIGIVFGVTASRISQIHAEAVALLRLRLSDWR